MRDEKPNPVQVTPALTRLHEHIDNLWSVANIAFKRIFETEHSVDNIVFFYGRRSLEELSEIILLCDHGYASGANAILRGMYERAVTAIYLSNNPDEVSAFLDFYWIAQRRLITQLKETFGPGILPKEEVEKIESRYQEVIHRFKVPDCRECGSEKTNHTWTRLDFPSMAKKAGPIGKLIALGYALPTQEAHATVKAILDRLTSETEGVLMFDPQADVGKIDNVLCTAHNIVLAMLDLQKTHFRIGALEEPLQQCMRDFQTIWKTKNANSSPT
jgi:hypothetical protein